MSGIRSGRRAAEREMKDAFTAYEPDPDSTAVDADGFEIPAFTPQGPTRGKIQGLGGLRGNDPQTQRIDVAGADLPRVGAALCIPISAPVPSPGWEYVCTEVHPESDPSLLGRRWRVVEVPAKSNATARRLAVVEVEA